MAFYAYMIKSESLGRNYYGHTSNIGNRLNSHNSTQNKYTRGKGPWKLIGYKECKTKGQAMKVEQKLKDMKNPSRAYNWLKNYGTIR
jgi:putative endonuclease